MLYIIGTTAEIPTLPNHLPEKLRSEIFQGLVVLDAEYGADRDYLATGGYSVFAETIEDIQELRCKLDIQEHTPEWATRIGSTGYLSALFIINNSFSIMAYMPVAIAPTSILTELEDSQ